MKPEFALSLTHDGIRLLQRSEDGWLELGGVDLASSTVEAELAALRERANARVINPPLLTKLILPNTEILYKQIEVRGATSPDYDAMVREALDGRTPYTLDELCYDYVVWGDTAQVAVVARETLIEAEDFAVAHQFNPVSFAAVPPKGVFAGEPMFGSTRVADALLSDTDPLERDAVPIVVLGTVPDTAIPVAPPTIDHPAPQAEPVAEPAAVDHLPEPQAVSAITTAPPEEKKPTLKAEVTPRASRTRAVAAEKPTPFAKLFETGSIVGARPAVLAGLGGIAAMAILGIGLLIFVPADSDAPQLTDTSVVPATDLPRPSTPDTDPPTASQENALDEETAVPTLNAAEPETAETAVAPNVMPQMDSTLISPSPSRVTAFDRAPLPEEVAEGAEAVPTSDGQSIVLAPTTQPGALGPAPIAGTGPGLLETETFYAVTGIWQRGPEQPVIQREPGLRGLYVASLDAEISIDDALALPSYEEDRDGLFETPLPPFAPGLVFDLDENGRVVATPDGALSPDGVMIFEGAGEISPRARPFNAVPTTDLNALAQLRPAPRPANAIELVERAALDGRTRSELAAFSPRPRPASAQQEALAAADEAPSSLAVAQAPSPRARPDRIELIVAEVRASQERQNQQNAASGSSTSSASLAAVAPAAQAAPALPTTASVARQATLENAMRLDRLNLIGVYGTSEDRRALVRTPSGRYLKLQVGDRLDGGRVAAIGEASLRYTKGSRNIVLEVPNG